MNGLRFLELKPDEPPAVRALKVAVAVTIVVGTLVGALVGAFAFEAITSPFMDWWWLVFIWFTPVMLVIVALMAAWTAIRR